MTGSHREPKQEKKKYSMRNRKNILTYVVAALSHPRDISDFVVGRAPTPAAAKLHWNAYTRRVHFL